MSFYKITIALGQTQIIWMFHDLFNIQSNQITLM